MARDLTKLKLEGKAQQSKKIITHPKAQRIVVDEIMDTGVARILRANRLPGYKASNLSIQTWSDEKEDFIEVWKIEAFVGFTGGRKLREGDIFFIKDSSLLNRNYYGKKIIKRTEAHKKHLVERIDDSIERARWEIKDETRRLSADYLATSMAEKARLYRVIARQKEVRQSLDKESQGK